MLQKKTFFTVNILQFRTWRMTITLSMEMLTVQNTTQIYDYLIVINALYYNIFQMLQYAMQWTNGFDRR